MPYVRLPGVTSQTLSQNSCPMLVAQPLGDGNPAHLCILPIFSADNMLRGIGVLFRAIRMLVLNGQKYSKTCKCLKKIILITANEN